jgi:transposase-like protein
MKGKRYTEEQIVRILGEVAGGRSIAETARQYGVAEGTGYW